MIDAPYGYVSFDVFCGNLLAGNRKLESNISDNSSSLSIAPHPARIQLPRLPNPPATILEFLCSHFSQVSKDVWTARVSSGKVRTGHDHLVSAASPYEPGITVFYFREVADEVEVPFREEIIFEDDHLLVADKPHFLPVTPAGTAVNECLLYRLQERSRILELAPLHRLDRETAGLVLFAKTRSTRARYAKLFADGTIERTYEALALVPSQVQTGREWLIENRLEAGHPWFLMKIAPGAPNASTRIVLTGVRDNLARFELLPRTGKKHQLRVHMMSVGLPILNDPYYPQLQTKSPEDYSHPLQLLASRIRFNDPFTGKEMDFRSQQKLSCW